MTILSLRIQLKEVKILLGSLKIAFVREIMNQRSGLERLTDPE